MNETIKLGWRRSFENIVFMLRYAVKYTPGYLAAVCLFEVFASVEVFFEFTYTAKYLLEAVETGKTFAEAVAYMLFITALVILKIIFAGVLEQRIVPASSEKLRKKMRLELYEKAVGLDLEYYDNPDYYNTFVWSISEADGRMDKILSDLRRMVSCTAQIAINGIFFLSLDRVGILFVLLSLLVTVAFHSRLGKLNFSRDSELKPLERKRNYFNRIFYLHDYAKELRLHPVGDMLKEDFSRTNRKIFPILKKYGGKQTLLGSTGDFLANNLLLDVAYIGYLLYQTLVKGLFTFGSMIGLYQASGSLKSSLNQFALLIPQFQQHSLYVEKMRTFLSFSPRIRSGDCPLSGDAFQILKLEHVSFSYSDGSGFHAHVSAGKESSSPKAESVPKTDTLHDINMEIRKGEKIAIVGYNGAGKTTLIKLLQRLYDVSDGRITVNGTDIRKIRLEDYRALYSSVFQDYKLYASSIASNVTLEPAKQANARAITDALKKSGFEERLLELKQGIWTELTKEFDDTGVNLSGGESQKVAIARTFYRRTPIIILDEPSSALDPVSEYALNQSMLKSSQDRTVIFISHRLSSTVLADKIYMLEKGRIIEEGSHRQLMEANGKYAEMFRMQSSRYHTF